MQFTYSYAEIIAQLGSSLKTSWLCRCIFYFAREPNAWRKVAVFGADDKWNLYWAR